MDPSDGKMEDDLYGLLGFVHGDEEDMIKKSGKLARLRYHPDKAERERERERERESFGKGGRRNHSRCEGS
eukprot:4256278-Karenia_brevis.AAC.1